MMLDKEKILNKDELFADNSDTLKRNIIRLRVLKVCLVNGKKHGAHEKANRSSNKAIKNYMLNTSSMN